VKMMRAESRGKDRAGSSVNSQTNSQLNAGINIQTKYFTAGRSGSRRRFVLPVLAAVFYLFLNLVTAVFWGAQALAAEPPVRVGYDLSGVLLYKDSDGMARGYNAEFLYELAKYTGWQYEFVAYPNWSRALQAVAAGEVDILPTVLKTPERNKTMLFANHWMGMINVALVVPTSDRKHFYGDLASLQGLRIGVRKNTKDAADVQSWASQVKLNYQLSVYDDNKELLQALDEGRIDAAGLSYVGQARKYRAIMEFAPQEMFFAIAPGRPDLKTKMDAAMVQISALNPEFFSSIVTKLAGRETNALPVFSLQEEEYIKAGNPVRVTFIRQAAPFSYQDKEGHFLGLLPELLNKIAKMSQLKFTYVPVDSGEEALRAVKEGRADVLGRMVNNLFFAAKYQLRPTSPYVYLPMVRIINRQPGLLTKIGVQDVSQIDLAKEYDQQALDKSYQVLDQAEKAFQALTEHRIDALYCDSVTAGYFMDTHRASEYQLSVLQPYSYDLTFGVCLGADPRLAVVLDKCIRCFNTKEVEELFFQSRMQETASLKNLVERLPVQYLILVMLVLLAGLVLFGYVSLNLWRKRDIEQRMQAVKEKSQQMENDLKTAKRVEAAKVQFFASVGQEMRRPVSDIVASLQEACQSKPDEQASVETLVRRALSSGLSLQDSLADMSLFTQLEYGSLCLNLESADSVEVMEEILAPYEAEARAKGLEFTVERSGLMRQKIRLDRKLVQLVFAKVLHNAVNFTPAGGSVHVTVESLTSAKGRYALWATVQDNGIGIGKEFLPNVYEPFSREDRPELKNVPGSGLGLTIARLVLNLLGGEIEVKSQYQAGTEVKLELYFDLADEKC
jgi:signal transduction histidine kinase/ABC-type amino acid transport substrate-binding protein